jgi:hypothetical protein
MPDDAQYVYDFQHPPVEDVITKGLGGMTVKADRKAFPLLIGNGVSMTVDFLGPCGFNTPHVHPRSAEINIAVQGHFATEYTLENGARSILNTLEQYQMTVFPQGALHAEWNPDCTNAVFVAGFASEDPGVQQAAQTLLGFSEEFVSPVFGSNNITFDGKDVDTFRAILPKNAALGIDTCLAKCGIQKSAKQPLVEVRERRSILGLLLRS